MYDAAMPPPELQRARGHAAVAFSLRGGQSRLDRLHQSGSAKAMLPASYGEGPELVFLNTAGGLTGGDALRYEVALGAGTRVTAATQTAERAYASSGGTARMDVSLTVGTGARLDWLPQETILFERAALARRTDIALAGDAVCLMVETLVLGRAAMGEVVERAEFSDHRRVTRDGCPVLVEPVRIDETVLSRRTGRATLAGARAVATLALIAPGAEDAAGRLRALPDVPGVTWAVSGWDGKCVLRAMAPDAFPLRRLVMAAIAALRPGPLPRVWTI
ncbi:urease accessory protein UreD [Anianabacter salinae]|uniref:urease accessory protein UreD n=1 Tax=Anianabacter salinae TaxID=2851023 RepID=UPI00225E4B7C|nr:urease accessory protein UreD [Anianabacter salinae]MBV0911485.1 urease accessory protein UreD [Anianabacter salinae]